MSAHVPKLVTLSVALAFVVGCGGGASSGARIHLEGQAPGRTAAEAPPAGGEQAKQDAKPPAEPAVKAPPAERKIIYTANLDVVVTDWGTARPEVDRLIAAHKGYVARAEERMHSGSQRSGTITIKVPVEHFQSLVQGLAALGHAERNAIDSQDVSEEYVDVQARVKNLKEQEAKLNELLKERRKEEKLDDIIKIGDRIGLVRQDVERAEGRLKYLATMAALSTVNLSLREVKDYKPPTAPTFGSRVGSTFSNSWDALVHFVTEVALAVVALVPWLPVLLPLGAVTYFVIRSRRARAKRAAGEAAAFGPRPVDQAPR
jgi:hypothetical protein